MNLQRGATRADGYRFNGYTTKGKEHWLSPVAFAKYCRSLMTEEQREKEREKVRRYYQKNAEKAKASTKKWKDANPEKVKAQQARWTCIPENRIRTILYAAKRRASSNGMEFDLKVEDLLPLPLLCPVLKMQLNYRGTQKRGFVDDSPSIDRIDPLKGYVKGNVQVISWRANRLKSDASVQEIEAVLAYVKRSLVCR